MKASNISSGLGGPTGQQANQEADVFRALALLEKEISILNEAIVRMENRLGPVLSDVPPPDNEKDLPRESYTTALARGIDQHAEHVADASLHLSRLENRLGL